jgi:hypothetical protein
MYIKQLGSDVENYFSFLSLEKKSNLLDEKFSHLGSTNEFLTTEN